VVTQNSASKKGTSSWAISRKPCRDFFFRPFRHPRGISSISCPQVTIIYSSIPLQRSRVCDSPRKRVRGARTLFISYLVFAHPPFSYFMHSVGGFLPGGFEITCKSVYGLRQPAVVCLCPPFPLGSSDKGALVFRPKGVFSSLPPYLICCSIQRVRFF